MKREINIYPGDTYLIPEYIRVSVGTAAVLGLRQMQMDAIPTTAYLMLYTEKKCFGNCGFCPQARESEARSDALSRIFWPKFELSELKRAFEKLEVSKQFKRICVQAINYVGFFDDLAGIVKTLNGLQIPISVSVHPLTEQQMKNLRELGVNRIGIPFDTATQEIFYKVKGKGAKGPYKWEKYLESIEKARSIFGSNNVSTHLIIGLGETDYEAIKFMQDSIDSQVLVALFTFTPIKGTTFEANSRPNLFKYRKMQLARYLLLNKISHLNKFTFNEAGNLVSFGLEKEKIDDIIRSGMPFLTSGCPGCNRPYYNERPGETLYNYPRSLSSEEIDKIIDLFGENT